MRLYGLLLFLRRVHLVAEGKGHALRLGAYPNVADDVARGLERVRLLDGDVRQRVLAEDGVRAEVRREEAAFSFCNYDISRAQRHCNVTEGSVRREKLHVGLRRDVFEVFAEVRYRSVHSHLKCEGVTRVKGLTRLPCSPIRTLPTSFGTQCRCNCPEQCSPETVT